MLNIIGKASIALCICMIVLVAWFSSYLSSDTFNLMSKIEGAFAFLAIVINFTLALVSFLKQP
jgi:hypothetical protein